MPDSFAEFLVKLGSRNAAAAQELFGRFTVQLIGLALRHINADRRPRSDRQLSEIAIPRMQHAGVNCD